MSRCFEKLNRAYLQLRKSVFVGNVIKLASGTALAQVINVIASPFITRLYGPEIFGIFGMITTIVGLLLPLATLTYVNAVVLPKEDSEAIQLSHLSIKITLVFLAAISLFFTVATYCLPESSDYHGVLVYAFTIPILIFLSVRTQVATQWIVRLREFGFMARISVGMALLLSSLKITFGVISPSVWSLVGIVFFVTLVKNRWQYTKIGKRGIRIKSSNSYQKSWSTLAREYRDFPLYQSPQILLNALGQSMPVLLLGYFYGASYAGFFILAKTLLTLPTNLIAKSVGDVVYPQLSSTKNKGLSIFPTIAKTTSGLFAVGFVPYAFLALYSPQLFEMVFGSEWVRSGIYAQYLAIWLFMSFINPPSVKAVIVLRAQRFAVVLNIFSTVLRILAFIIGYYYFHSDIVSIALFSIVGILHNLIFILVTTYIAKKNI